MEFLDRATVNGQTFDVKLGEWVTELMVSNLSYPSRERTGKMRGAEIASQCIRLNQFRLEDTKQEGMSGYSVICTETGKAVEELVTRNLLTNSPDAVAMWNEWIPKTKKMGLNYSGKVDLVLNYNGTLVVVDTKTATRIADEKRVDLSDVKRLLGEDDILEQLAKSKGGLRRSPLKMDNYLAQVLGYATFLDLEWALVFVYSRSKESFYEDVTVTHEVLHVTDEDKYAVIARMLMATRLNDQYNLASIPVDFKKTKQCNYCDFKPICWEGESHNYENELTVEQAQEYYDELYDEAVELYEEHRGLLGWMRDKKIEEAQEFKDVIAGATKEELETYLQSVEISLDDLLFKSSPHWKKSFATQFATQVNVYNSKD